MRVQIASDLHLDVLENRGFDDLPLQVATDADVLVLAGDVHCGTHAVDYFEHWPVPVVYVSGNHEAFGLPYASVVEALRVRSAGTQVRYLERQSVVIGGVRFLGACLWTDYELYSTRDSSMDYARAHMSDHSAIWLTDTERFSPEHAFIEHKGAVDWLTRQLSIPFPGKTVVVTHHGVSPDSIHPRFLDHPINPGFLSDLRNLLGQANLWIHGHVHDSFDYHHGASRVVANPRGYPANLGNARSYSDLTWENPAFCSTKVVEL
ncbi:Calcineurin-like phosphoesterase [Burkholderia sp. WP9]|jgi:calcineurin-like phosphoesterase family protein|uniref:metallophosphoesterase n=1 Tax=Burkholderia sp. WP9 TaxID=1500263 RepID=UPI00089994C2|nr:metallophosphoesterase [Burkholderia sp. WP9]SEE70635.1 Calcineurin-like phosphoesterase [Burkholderia sp. WP9]